ncbi:MAG: YaiI/YqxD family protein, partial [Cyanobacteria bacterium P01_G01_bin.4]
RASKRRKIPITLVANQPLQPSASSLITTIQVPAGLDAADHRIVEEMEAGDLVITADIPLAANVIEKGGHALNPRGELYTKNNIRERLALRNFMDDLRSTGVNTGGPPALNQRDRQAFANQLDRFISKYFTNHKP